MIGLLSIFSLLIVAVSAFAVSSEDTRESNVRRHRRCHPRRKDYCSTESFCAIECIVKDISSRIIQEHCRDQDGESECTGCNDRGHWRRGNICGGSGRRGESEKDSEIKRSIVADLYSVRNIVPANIHAKYNRELKHGHYDRCFKLLLAVIACCKPKPEHDCECFPENELSDQEVYSIIAYDKVPGNSYSEQLVTSEMCIKECGDVAKQSLPCAYLPASYFVFNRHIVETSLALDIYYFERMTVWCRVTEFQQYYVILKSCIKIFTECYAARKDAFITDVACRTKYLSIKCFIYFANAFMISIARCRNKSTAENTACISWCKKILKCLLDEACRNNNKRNECTNFITLLHKFVFYQSIRSSK